MSESTSSIRALFLGGACRFIDHDAAPYPPDGSPPSPLRVLVHPHIDEANAYLRLMTDALGAQGVESRPFSWRCLLRGDVDILHVHWPELAVGPRALWKACVASLLLVLTVTVAQLRGMAIVWTVHNIGSHDAWHPRLERALFWWWTRQVDAALTLSEWARGEATTLYPHLSLIPLRTVGHGTYPAPTALSRTDARRKLGIELDARVVLHFGHLRPYKGTDQLVRTFAEGSVDATLLVRGRVRPPTFGEELQELAARDPRVKLDLSQATTDELWTLLAACDVVVLPYRKVSHAGSVILALCTGRPTVTTATGSMPELQEEVGHQWLRLLDVDYDAEQLERSIVDATASPPADPPTMPSHDWAYIARLARALYDEARAARGGDRVSRGRAGRTNIGRVRRRSRPRRS